MHTCNPYILCSVFSKLLSIAITGVHWNTLLSLVLCFFVMVSANPISLFFHLVVNGFCFTSWRASEASETPSIATYRKKCLGVSMSKPQCACAQFYVKRRSGRACIYEKPACCSRVRLPKARFTCVKMTKRMHIK